MKESARLAPAPAAAPAAARPHPRPAWLVSALCLAFFVQGLTVAPFLGIQNDEVLFGAGVYPPWGVEYTIRMFHGAKPAMLMSYLGALKIWIYKVIFRLSPPSVWSVRLPMVFAGALTVFLFYVLVRRFAGVRAALVTTALLAFDTTWLLTTTLDWGPVALQHLLLAGGMLCLYSFYEGGRRGWLAAGFVLFGLGLWDKALFAWVLAGLGAAALAVFPRQIVTRLTARNVATAGLAFAIGCAPLLMYNLHRPLGTARGTIRVSSDEFSKKLWMVRISLEGSSLFGYIVHDDPPPQPAKPSTAFEQASVRLSDAFGRPRTSLTGYAFLLALMLFPWLWDTPARKPMLCALVFMAITWVQMAFLRQAGGGAHHTVLLWPFPQILIGAAFAETSRRAGRAGLAILVVLIALICGSALLVTNEHLAQLVRNGPTAIWTDAIQPLASEPVVLRAARVYCMDWGILDSLRLLDRGRLPLVFGPDQAFAGNGAEMMRQPNAVFVGHSAGTEFIQGVAAQMEKAAAASGYAKQVLREIRDRHGRPVFEIYRYAPKDRSLTVAAR